MNSADTSAHASAHSGLYRLGGAAALLVAGLTLAEVVAFVVWPPPDTVAGWFALFERSPLVGLVDFWGLEYPMYAAFVLTFLALYHALEPVAPSTATVALVGVLLGAAVFFVANNPFTMLTLSRAYAGATADLDRAALLGAGEAVLAGTNQRAIGGFNAALFLVSLAGLAVAIAMQHSPHFTRLDVWLGVAAFGLSLADYIRQPLTDSVLITLLIVLPNALAILAWFTRVGLRLMRLAQSPAQR